MSHDIKREFLEHHMAWSEIEGFFSLRSACSVCSCCVTSQTVTNRWTLSINAGFVFGKFRENLEVNNRSCDRCTTTQLHTVDRSNFGNIYIQLVAGKQLKSFKTMADADTAPGADSPESCPELDAEYFAMFGEKLYLLSLNRIFILSLFR